MKQSLTLVLVSKSYLEPKMIYQSTEYWHLDTKIDTCFAYHVLFLLNVTRSKIPIYTCQCLF